MGVRDVAIDPGLQRGWSRPVRFGQRRLRARCLLAARSTAARTSGRVISAPQRSTLSSSSGVSGGRGPRAPVRRAGGPATKRTSWTTSRPMVRFNRAFRVGIMNDSSVIQTEPNTFRVSRPARNPVGSAWRVRGGPSRRTASNTARVSRPRPDRDRRPTTWATTSATGAGGPLRFLDNAQVVSCGGRPHV